MKDILRPILELLVVLPGLLLGYFPVKTYLKQSPGRLAAWLFPLMACLCIGSGLACYRLHASTVFALSGVALAAICLYTRTLTISLWKSGTIALSVCAVFACVNSLSRAVSAAIIRNLQLPPDGPWLCLGACVFYNAVCWVIVLAAYYPATHTVRAMVEDDNFAQTWYVFWVLPLAFILLNLFMIPRYQSTLQTGRVLQGYIVLSSALLVFMFCFNAIFLLMATSLNRNAKLQQENQFLSMQQQRYENLRTAIEEARQARHDMRHQLNQISALAEAGDLENLKSYLAKTVSRIPNLDMCFCENRAADSVVGYYCAMAKRDEIPFRARLDLPETLPVDEIDMCLVLSNLLENALEASLRTAPVDTRTAQQREIDEAKANGTWGIEYTTCQKCGYHNWTRKGNVYVCDTCGNETTTVVSAKGVKGYVGSGAIAPVANKAAAPETRYANAKQAQAAADAREAAYAAAVAAFQKQIAANEAAYLAAIAK